MQVKLKLNSEMGKVVERHDYVLDPTNEYLIDFENEAFTQAAITAAFINMGFPPAIKDYHNWLSKNGYNVEIPFIPSYVLKKHYGKTHLWKTKYSQGIVIKDTDNNYYILMECSALNEGYRYTQVIIYWD